ncbi:MAG: hypothetical protein DCO96_10145 [Fluviicola sp. XM-24bin1]|nr:MAG: hypothetical protein DCO96_10145 [Fluviicola sp. XM-24bin1]
MRLFIVHILFVLLAKASFGQDYLSEAKQIRDIEQAQAFADSLPQVVLGFLHDKMVNEDYQSRKDKLKPGDSFESGSYHVVTIDKGSKEIYRFRLLTMSAQNTPGARGQINRIYQELEAGAEYEELFTKYAQNSGPDKEVYGDVGWVDLDYFVDSFQDAVRGKKKGEQFVAGDDQIGWYNIVDMTHNPTKMKGHFVLLIPNTSPTSYFDSIDHEKSISKLKSTEDLRAFAEKYPGDVQLEILNKASNPELFEEMKRLRAEGNKKTDDIISSDYRSYKFVIDTTVQLFSFQYVYLDGSKMTREERTESIHDIYDQFYANVPFDSIVEQYWPDHNGMSILRNIESGLLADDLVEKVKSTTVGQLFVARVGQSYFLGVPLEKPKQLESILVISYPKLTDK